MSAPEPGVYPDVAADDYHAWPAASASWLTHLDRSPSHLRAYLDQEMEDTPALRLGRAIHVAVLEPERFREAYAVEPDPSQWGKTRGTKAYKEAVAEMEEAGVEVLTADEWEQCRRTYQAVWNHKAARGLMKRPGASELSIVWTDEATGMPCKARIDRHAETDTGGAVVDLKTTRDASYDAFERSVYTYDYWRRAAWYLRGARAVGLPARYYVFVAVEKEPPYAPAVYRMCPSILEPAEEEIDRLLRLLKDVQDNDRWAEGYGDEIKDIAVPTWAYRQIEERTA